MQGTIKIENVIANEWANEQANGKADDRAKIAWEWIQILKTSV